MPAARLLKWGAVRLVWGVALAAAAIGAGPTVRADVISNGAEWESGLPVALPSARRPRVETAFLSRPGTEWRYSHHPHLAFFNGRFYALWSNGRTNEDRPGQRVLLATSADFSNWTSPQPLVDTVRDDNGNEQVLTAVGFHQNGPLLVAYVASFAPHKKNRLVEALTTTNGVDWSAPRDIGLPLCPNHSPEPTASGRLIMSGNIAYPWTDDPSGLSGWRMAGIYPAATAARIQTRLASFWDSGPRNGLRDGYCEGSFFQTDDGVIHMLLRNGNKEIPHRLWLAESRDNGLTWSAPVPTGFSDAGSKFHFGRLPDGRFYYVGNPLWHRTPLVLSLSSDGVQFNLHFILAEANRKAPKGSDEYGYPAYPHSLVHDGYLYVIVSRDKNKVEVLRVALSELSPLAPLPAQEVSERKAPAPKKQAAKPPAAAVQQQEHFEILTTVLAKLGHVQSLEKTVITTFVLLLFLLVGVWSVGATVVKMCRGRYHPWIRGIADLLVCSFILGFTVAFAMLVSHAGEGAALVPGFLVLAGSGVALGLGLLIRSRTGGGFGPAPGDPDLATVARNRALAAKVLRFVGAPPEAIAAVTAPPDKPRMSIPVLSRPNPCPAPPRQVPLWVRLQVLFGGFLNQFGWVFFGFGMIAVWLFVCRADLTSWYRFRGPLQTAQGRVIASTDTGATEGGSKHSRGTPVYKNEFSFVVDDKTYQGLSYATGRGLLTGRAVTIEYLPGQPGVARIQGMRANVFGPEVIFVLLFPLIGLGIVIFGFRRGLKECDLLANGVPTSARLIAKEPTGSRVNNRTVYKYTFTFKTLEDQVCQASDNTDADRFVDDSEEHIVYDPRQPQRALLLENLPGSPQIGEDGHLIGHRPMLALGYCLLPGLTILGHGWWALWLLTHSTP